MKLPDLSLDCRDKTIAEFSGRNQIPIIVAETDVRVAVVTADSSGHFDTAAALVDRFNAYPKLRAALRLHVILETQKAGVPRVEYDGYRCLLCRRTWKLLQPEKHEPTCLMEGSNASSK